MATEQEVVSAFKRANFAVSEYDATTLADIAAKYGITCGEVAQRYDLCAMNRYSKAFYASGVSSMTLPHFHVYCDNLRWHVEHRRVR